MSDETGLAEGLVAARPASGGRGRSGHAGSGGLMARFDPGWLFLFAGLAVLASVMLIPAGDDLESARWQRDRALAIERHRLERLERYATYLDAVERGDEAVIRSLAAMQLNKAPAGWIPVAMDDSARGAVGLGGVIATDPARATASVFPALEPEPLKIEERVKVRTTLSDLVTGEESRWLMLIGGAVCVLVGVLPTARR
ncbi:MAG: hypothetical protein H7Y88_06590 [Phycisphaerales bacterium]|nr:hypothetical protein [Phycisphaerales bacterium]